MTFRLVTMDDADLLLEWRNDLRTRKSSHRTKKIEKSEHMKSLNETLRDDWKYIFIAEENDKPIGVVRVDRAESPYKLSWTVAPGSRKKGLGKKMVNSFSNLFFVPICCEIKSSNVASIKIAEHCGMKLTHKFGDILYYERKKLQ